jgi:type I restriction enzyme R subunit
MPSPYSEGGLVEQPALELLGQLGWTVVNAFNELLGPAGTLGRDSMHEVVLSHRVHKALRLLNPRVPGAIREEALAAVAKDRSVMDRVRANREVYDLVRDGYRAEWQGEDGERQHATVRYVDFQEPSNNDWLAAAQVWVAGDLYRRRADTVLFVNGIPLVLLEFKEPNRPAKAAYDENLSDYRDTVPQLFVPNALVILSNGSEAKVGSTYAPWEFFGDWKVIDAGGTRGVVALETAIRGTCAPAQLLDLVENFVAYLERPAA